MDEVYTLNVKKGNGEKYTETTFQTKDIRDIKNLLQASELQNNDETIYEETDKNDINYDYSFNDEDLDDIASGKSIDSFDYKGREESDGVELRDVNTYGNNPIKPRTEDLTECDNFNNGIECSCPLCNQSLQNTSYEYTEQPELSYKIESKNSLIIYDTNSKTSVILTGEDADNAINQINAHSNNVSGIQSVLNQYTNLMENNENVFHKKLMNEWKNYKRK